MSSFLFLVILVVLVALCIGVKVALPKTITWAECGTTLTIVILSCCGIWLAGSYSQVHDIEIWNGEVIKKERIHDTYEESYDCRCRTVKSGDSTSEECDTCYRTHYTVEWNCITNLGTIEIKSEDETDDDVYDLPDPQRYKIIQKGDPVAQENSYVNYVKAVPDSLFHKINTSTYVNKIPPYPENVYDFYKIDRVLSVGVNVPDLKEWNYELSLLLRKLGPQKQANVVVIFTNVSDQSYLYALEGEWIGGNKNDIIVVIGTSQYPKIDWVGVSSWTDSELFKVELRDSIYSLTNVDRKAILSLIDEKTSKLFVRKQMKDFEYLKDKIEPPTWAVILTIVFGLISLIGCSIYFHKNETF